MRTFFLFTSLLFVATLNSGCNLIKLKSKFFGHSFSANDYLPKQGYANFPQTIIVNGQNISPSDSLMVGGSTCIPQTQNITTNQFMCVLPVFCSSASNCLITGSVPVIYRRDNTLISMPSYTIFPYNPDLPPPGGDNNPPNDGGNNNPPPPNNLGQAQLRLSVATRIEPITNPAPVNCGLNANSCNFNSNGSPAIVSGSTARWRFSFYPSLSSGQTTMAPVTIASVSIIAASGQNPSPFSVVIPSGQNVGSNNPTCQSASSAGATLSSTTSICDQDILYSPVSFEGTQTSTLRVTYSTQGSTSLQTTDINISANATLFNGVSGCNQNVGSSQGAMTFQWDNGFAANSFQSPLSGSQTVEGTLTNGVNQCIYLNQIQTAQGASSNTASPDFLWTPATTNGCSSGSLLTPGSTCRIRVTFQPSGNALTQRTASLKFLTANSGTGYDSWVVGVSPLMISLSGTIQSGGQQSLASLAFDVGNRIEPVINPMPTCGGTNGCNFNPGNTPATPAFTETKWRLRFYYLAEDSNNTPNMTITSVAIENGNNQFIPQFPANHLSPDIPNCKRSGNAIATVLDMVSANGADSCNQEIVFAPTQFGQQSANLVIQYQVAGFSTTFTKTVALSATANQAPNPVCNGTGQVPQNWTNNACLGVQPPEVNFGTVAPVAWNAPSGSGQTQIVTITSAIPPLGGAMVFNQAVEKVRFSVGGGDSCSSLNNPSNCLNQSLDNLNNAEVLGRFTWEWLNGPCNLSGVGQTCQARVQFFPAGTMCGAQDLVLPHPLASRGTIKKRDGLIAVKYLLANLFNWMPPANAILNGGGGTTLPGDPTVPVTGTQPAPIGGVDVRFRMSINYAYNHPTTGVNTPAPFKLNFRVLGACQQ